ncbi:hypothetical protein [Thermoactinomyces sp. DSM 45892]|uniref:putative amidoligase domain-containing protein n=1 Tax=Thermoactinomyces sp. DSM 45892 TaxID=1882753 RepID=UPI0008994021|nr:hypothetical protein [Thermoactinomyces sp. DSM 45892]SDY98867.1 Phage phiEco32-like COOH.NH2 ligase-type 2 [Thermoactinomyces sp. DSM 45892]
MGAVTLPLDEKESEQEELQGLREQLVSVDHRFAPSILLETNDDQIQISGAIRMSSTLYTLNNEKHVEKLKSAKQHHDILQLHGLQVVGSSRQFLREYVFSIFQTKVLSVYRSKETSVWLSQSKKKQKVKRKTYVRVTDPDHDREIKRVQKVAVRALYATGLDYGMVTCGVGTSKKISIVQVDPSPKLNEDLERLFIKAVSDYRKNLRKSSTTLKPIMLGADPEFIMVTPKGNLIVASKYFPIQGKIGCDAAWLGDNRSHKPIVELRPDPTSDPLRLSIRVYQCLLHAAKKVQHVQCKWLAGALPYPKYPIGGHVHFSGIEPSFQLLRALDNYLALPLVVCEDPRGKDRRPKYGFLGDYRMQEHGGFEYRTPPSWLITPVLTKGVLVLSKIIAGNFEQLMYNPLSDPDIQQAYYDGNKAVLKEWIPDLWQDIKRLDDYEAYQNVIDEFFSFIQQGKTWDESADLRKAWRLPPYHTKKR